MKKLFSLFAAFLFVGSMWATPITQTYTLSTSNNGKSAKTGDVTWNIGSGAIEESNSKTKLVGTITVVLPENATLNSVALAKGNNWGSGATVTFASGSTSLNVFSNSGSFDLTTNKTDGTYTFTKTGSSSKNAWVSTISVTYEVTIDPSAPLISADDVDFGTRVISMEEANFELDTTLTVTGANLGANITPAGSTHVTITEESLPAAGGTLHLHIVAAKGDFSEEITLTSGGTSKTVTISGKVKQTAIAPGTPATMNSGTKTSSATVNGASGIKAGTSSDPGSFTVTVGANANKLHFFGAAWKDAAGNITLSAPDGVTLSLETIDLEEDDGIAGSSTDYELKDLDPVDDCLYTVNLTGVTTATDITFASGTAQRFVIWGATYETNGGGTALETVESSVKSVKFIENGQLFIEQNGHIYNVMGQLVK